MRQFEQAMSPEVREELRALLREELVRQDCRRREAMTVFRRACEDEKERFDRCDYIEHQDYHDVNGNLISRDSEKPMGWQVQNAIGTLLRAVYRVKGVKNLPPEREQEIRSFVRSVLDLMEGLSGERDSPGRDSA